MDRRTFVAGTVACATAAASGPTLAQDAYPSRPITFINPFPPGGAADVVGRPFAAALEPIIKQPCIIDTKPGAAGAVGAQFAASAKPDGYTLLLHLVSISGFAEVDRLFGRQPKFSNADFVPIARLIADPCVLLVNDQQPYKTLAELIEDAKKKPNGLVFSSSGLYGALHLPTALFMKAAGVEMRHLPTPGGGPALTALIGNNAQVLISSIAAASTQMKAGKARALASFGAKRSAQLPNVPTIAESGIAEFDMGSWYGLWGPAGLPEPIAAKLQALAAKAMTSKLANERLATQNFVPETNVNGDAFAQYIARQLAVYSRIVRDANITVD